MDDAKFFLRSALVGRESKGMCKKKGGAREARTRKLGAEAQSWWPWSSGSGYSVQVDRLSGGRRKDGMGWARIPGY